MGVINVFAVGFILGKYPEYYWILVYVKGFYCLGFVWHWRWNDAGGVRLMYMIELCWVIKHVFLVYMTAVSLSALGLISNDFVFSTSHYAFKIYWGLANGPLAFAALSLGNAMVFHNKQ